MIHYTIAGYCNAWGSAKGARRVHGLTNREKQLIREGCVVWLQDCPIYRGQSVRRIIENNGRFYARMPVQAKG